MSYLSALRLHFAGQFQANVSTVNNDPLHFDNSQFLPTYQTMQTPGPFPNNGWFNPAGDAAWRLIKCQVTSVAMPQPVAGDPVLSCLLADSDSHACAKLVDLDSEQQLVSEIWGLLVRITDPHGHTLLSGHFEPAGFMDIWDRAASSGGGGDQIAGAMYQSVLTGLQWGDVSGSAFLTALKAAATEGVLSIKFNVDGINLSFGSPNFMCGRIVGTIGPATPAEPQHFVLGRQFMAVGRQGGNFFAPMGQLNFCVARIDQTLQTIFLDLGNALPTHTAGGSVIDLGPITLLCPPAAPGGDPLVLGVITDNPGDPTAYTQPDWYTRTAGVVELPLPSGLTPAQQSSIANSPLSLCLAYNSGATLPAISEWSNGTFVRADRFVYRMNPSAGETDNKVPVKLYATRFGAPLAGQAIDVVFDPSGLQGGQLPWDPEPAPPVAVPLTAVTFTSPTPVTDAGGLAILELTAADPQNPRGYIDGQVYGLRASLPGGPDPASNTDPTNPWLFISLLVWDRFQPDQPVTWYGSMQPIFQQYANLYPVMRRFLDMSDYESVCAQARLLILAFGLDPANPNSMPVTRDLSEAKRLAILHWLQHPGPDGQPLLGERQPLPGATHQKADALLATTLASPDPLKAKQASPAGHAPSLQGKGGKASAVSRRRGHTPLPA